MTPTSPTLIKLALKLLAPYLAVAIFWCGMHNAWLAILVYHAQIVLWSWRRFPAVMRGYGTAAGLAIALPAALGGVLVYFLLPFISAVPLSQWLAANRLTGRSLLLMIPYFGLVHPILEQVHWDGLRRSTALAHPLFAGYHMLVLGSLLTPAWMLAAFAVLTGASMVWAHVSRRQAGLFVPCCSHILADLGIILAAWLKL